MQNQLKSQYIMNFVEIIRKCKVTLVTLYKENIENTTKEILCFSKRLMCNK